MNMNYTKFCCYKNIEHFSASILSVVYVITCKSTSGKSLLSWRTSIISFLVDAVIKLFELDFCTRTRQTANQNTVSNIYSDLIG